MKLSRREMLTMMGSGVCVAGLPAVGEAGLFKKKKKIGLALQLYSIRNHCGQDIDKALAQVAELGYEAVEFAGYYKYGNDAAALKAKLDSLGLKVAGTHIRAGELTEQKIEKTIAFHKEIGCKYLVVPGDGRFTHPEKSKEFASQLKQAAATLKPHGMACGYHNHTKEFSKQGDKTYWDLFAERTGADVVLQQDVGWTTHAGLDPVELIKKYPGRTKTAHFKPTVAHGDKDKQPIIGQDSVNWKGIISACYDVGGTDWFIVEQERYLPGKSPMECSGISLDGLKAILKEMKKL